MRKRRGRRGRNQGRNDDSGKRQNGGNAGDVGDRLRIRPVVYLNGTPGNRSTSSGESIFMVSIADTDGLIETIAISLADTKSLIIDGLISLHAADQKFATYLLDRYFRHDSPHQHDDWGNVDS